MESLLGSVLVAYRLCEACFCNGRPLSPYEDLSGDRFWDHLSDEDRALDIALLQEKVRAYLDQLNL